MSKPLVVTIPHRLGKAEAVRRLKSGMQRARDNFAGVMTITEDTWDGDRLTFRGGLLGQTTGGTIDVREDHVQIEVQLPWMLAQLAARARGLIEKQGLLMLDKK